MKASTPIGIIGLGIMGSSIARHIIQAGYGVVGYDVRASRVRALRSLGGIAATSAGEVAGRARVIITSLPSADALEQTAAAVASGANRPLTVVETSTLSIDTKLRAQARLRARRIKLLDCPISGTGAQARAKDIVVYASGDRTAYRQVSPVLDAFTRAHYYVGAFGNGSKVKFVANLLVAVHNVAAAEALVLAKKAGLDPGSVLKLVADGAGSSRVLQLRGPMMVKGSYEKPTMTLANWQKDMAIIGEFARKVGATTPLFAATAPIYAEAAKLWADHDTAAVCAVLENMAADDS